MDVQRVAEVELREELGQVQNEHAEGTVTEKKRKKKTNRQYTESS